MKAMSESKLIIAPRPVRGSLTAAKAGLFAAFMLAGAALAAQASPPADAAGTASEDDMFGAAETVTQANNVSKEAEGQSEFLKYDQVKVGGSFTGKVGFTSAWASAWDGSAQLFDSSSHYLTPDVEGQLTIVAKPLTDFGVNMDFRTSWPFATTSNYLTSATTSGSSTIPNIAVWSLYSKFNWQDNVYFSFGKQPISWGVSKGYFQPADDIFAVSTAIDPTNTGKEREGPVSLKTTIPMGVTNNFYIYAGLPTNTDGSTSVDPADARLAVKGEYGFGNTELALAGFYSYNDHPRALLMATTGLGSWNLLGEAILKYGSERYFLTKDALGVVSGLLPEAGNFYFTGTAGGYYFNSDSRVTILMQYLYNGEGQTAVSAKDAYTYYLAHPDQIDRIKVGTHYAFVTISDTDLFAQAFGADKLGASLIAIANLADLSGYIMPSLTWKFFDYISLQLGATFSFGEAGDEYITYGVGQPILDTSSSASLLKSLSNLPTAPGAALNLTLTVGTGAF
jgi:hypothetical protein